MTVDEERFIGAVRTAVSRLVADGDLPARTGTLVIGPGTRVSEFGADSLATASIVAALLDEVDLLIPEEAFMDDWSLSEIIAYWSGGGGTA